MLVVSTVTLFEHTVRFIEYSQVVTTNNYNTLKITINYSA
jgi:hypothetical protein